MNYFWAFCVGGALCVAGQLLIDLTKLTPARILVAFVVAGVVLSALGWYAPLAEFAGAGATVPLLGFGHLLAQGVVNAVNKSGLLGVLTGAHSPSRSRCRPWCWRSPGWVRAACPCRRPSCSRRCRRWCRGRR